MSTSQHNLSTMNLDDTEFRRSRKTTQVQGEPKKSELKRKPSMKHQQSQPVLEEEEPKSSELKQKASMLKHQQSQSQLSFEAKR